MDQVLQQIFEAIVTGDGDAVQVKTQEALDNKLVPETILKDGMTAAMDEIGRLFEGGEFFVPEMLLSARTMQSGLAILRPHLMDSNVASIGKVVAGTIQGDLHDIGKDLVCMMLEGAGFEIYDLGTDVSGSKFVEAARDQDADLVAISALLTTTMANIEGAIEALEEAGLRNRVKILIGGATVTEEFANKIGADGYAPDASRAVTVAKSLIGS